MALTLLLEKYDVSTEEGLQKALSELENEEAEVDEALSNALGKACSLEGRLRSASQAYTQLEDVRNDAQIASDMVEKTAALARDVSAKVRQLDLARTRVAECQRRVHDLIDLQLCSEGVEAAIKSHDYETAACHVSRFLAMEPASLAAARARRPSDAGVDPRQALSDAADTLWNLLQKKFEEAARKEDDAGVERIFKLMPQIGRTNEGIDLLAKYHAKKLDAGVRRACVVTPEGAGAGALWADAATRVVEAGAGAVRALRPLLPPAGAARAMTHLQPPICAGVRRVYASWMEHNKKAVGGATGAGAARGAAELALIHSRIHMYFSFLKRRAEADAALLPEADRQSSISLMHQLISSCALTRTSQDVLAEYLSLERTNLEENVAKALRLAGGEEGSLVDDVFFIAKRVLSRALSTGSAEAVCALLNMCASSLEHGVAPALRSRLRTCPPELLPLPGAGAGAGGAAGYGAVGDALAARLNRDVEAQRAAFIAHLNEACAGAAWSEQLAADVLARAQPFTHDERDKIAMCAGELGAAAAAFRAAQDAALAAVRAALHAPAVAAAASLVQPTTRYDDFEDDSEADALPSALEALSAAAQDKLPQCAAAILHALVVDIVTRAEAQILNNRYDRRSGLIVEARCRRLTSWCGAACGSARDRCRRLAAAAALLAAESCREDVAAAAALLNAAYVREVLATRTDFKMEDIKRLKL